MGHTSQVMTCEEAVAAKDSMIVTTEVRDMGGYEVIKGVHRTYGPCVLIIGWATDSLLMPISGA